MEKARQKTDQESANSQHVARGKSVSSLQSGKLAEAINSSPRVVIQQQKFQNLFGSSIQLQSDEEILPQSRQQAQLQPHSVPSSSGVAQRATLEIGKTFHYTPANRNQGQLGLGEKLTLTSAATGPDHEGQGTGAAVYNKESGLGTLTGDEYIADGSAGDVQFSVKRDDESDELKDTLDMTVVKPNSATFSSVSASNGDYGFNEAGAGFVGGESVYGPDTVSFKGLLFREGEDEADTTGSFKKWDKLKHDKGNWVGVSEQNKETGITDDIQSGAITKAEFDNVDTGGPGYFKWSIPWEYKVPGKSKDTVITAIHKATLDAAGKMKMEKLNGSEERAVEGGPWS